VTPTVYVPSSKFAIAPNTSLTRDHFGQAKERVEPLLPVHCVVEEATLLVEHEPDRLHVRATFPFGD